jgi:hypothetical protein
MNWLIRLILTIILAQAACLFAEPSDECRVQKVRLPYAEIQARLLPLFKTLALRENEKALAARFYTWASRPFAGTYSVDALQLSIEIQRFLALERHPSPSLKLMWASLLLASEQVDVANRTLALLPRSDLQLFLRAEVQRSAAAYRIIRPKDQTLAAFVHWRLADIALEQGNVTEAWQSFINALNPQELTQLSSPRYRQKTLLDFGASRLDPQAFWAKIPLGFDREWLAVCILSSKAGESQKQVAFRQLNELPRLTEQSLRYASQGLAVLREKRASLSSQVAWARTTLSLLSKHKEPASPLRQRLIAEMKNDLGQIVEKDSRSEGLKLAAALAPFIATATPSEALPFRILKAKLHENMGDFTRAAQEYKTIWGLQPKASRDLALAKAWFEVSDRAAPLIEGDRPPLTGGALLAAQNLLESCDAFAEAQGLSGQSDDRCAAYSIALAINQKNQDLAVRRLWLFISRFPKESLRIVEPMLQLFAQDPSQLVKACEQLLLVPQLQNGPSGKLIRDRMRLAKYRSIESLESVADRAAAYAAFAEAERPHELALQAIEKAISLSQNSWQEQVKHLEIYLQKFSEGPNALTYALKAAQMSEENFAFKHAYAILQNTKSWTWTVDQRLQRDEILCRLDILDRPLEAPLSCQLPMTHAHHYALDVAKALARQGEAAALYAFVMSPAVHGLPLRLDDKSALLAAAFDGTETIPNYQNAIKAQLYELYAENSSSLSLPSRRLYSIIAYKVARKSLSLYLDMPVFANQSDEFLPAVQAKRSAYKDLENLYIKVLQTKDPYWGANALADLSRAALNLSDTLERLPPIDGLDPKVIETELRSPIAQWTARGKSYASSSLKTLETFGLIHENAEELIRDMQRARKDKIQWDDRLPLWGTDEFL